MEGDGRNNLHNYADRLTLEICYSCLKRVMREIIRQKRTDCMIREVGLKVIYYSMTRENAMG
jgi:hypothetical protein